MSVSEKESGIVAGHIAAIERAAATRNAFIFIRPTEFDSTILIRFGYATKSTDVHNKSSNWGPMAGFVPCDPAFSKKCEGVPNAQEAAEKHHAAHPVQLTLKPELLAVHEKIEFQTNYLLTRAEGGQKLDVPWEVKRTATATSNPVVGSARARFEAFQKAAGDIPEHKFCTAKPAGFGNKSTLFCLIQKANEWLVYWVQWDGATGRLRPLRVFAYPQRGRLNPVTGDYDLWMVAPHFTHFDTASAVQIQEDSHGPSAASAFTFDMLDRLNYECGRASNPVFNHGAEMQNYGFTQALDWNLAMFTPSGSSRMVRINQIPGILADMQQAGYLVVWNKRYGETDPRLGGAAHSSGVPKLSQIRSQLDELFRQLQEIRQTANPAQIASQVLESQAQGAARMPDLMKRELGLMADRFSATRSLGPEHARIYRFHRSLLDFLNSQATRLRVLGPQEFAPGYRAYESNVLTLHSDLQQALVSTATGTGQSDKAQLDDWLQRHQPQINELKRYWGFA